MRQVWIDSADVQGDIEPGRMVTTVREIDDFCLRGDDGSAPIPRGAVLEVEEARPWGKAIARETDMSDEGDAIARAMFELADEGLWEFVTETAPEITPTGDIEARERATTAVRL